MARVVVTGVSSYTGACIAQALAGRGHEVVGTCRRAAGSYEGLAERRLSVATRAGVRLVFGLEAGAFPAWVSREEVDVWIHHHHPMENFRSATYDIGAAEAQVLTPVPDLVQALEARSTRLVVYSSTYFEAGEGGQGSDAQVTPYAALKARVLEAIEAACRRASLPLSRVVIPAPTGALENADRLTPQLLVAAQGQTAFLLRSPDSIMDLIPGEALAESYATLVDEGLDGAEVRTCRPSGLVTSAGAWAGEVDLRIARPLGWQLQLNVPAPADRSPAVRFQNPSAERMPVDWDAFFSRYVSEWRSLVSPS